MRLTKELKDQLVQYFQFFENSIVFGLSVKDDENSKKVSEFVHEIADLTDKITVEERDFDIKPSFSVEAVGQDEARIIYAGIPLGHEFESLVLSMIQVSGRPPVVDDSLKERVQAIDKDLNFTTYVTLSCQNCPTVVQALNLMSVLNPRIKHTIIEGSMFQEMAEEQGVMAVPATFLNGEEFNNGRASLEELLKLLDGEDAKVDIKEDKLFDILVVGGGPAGASASIYAARKGIDVALVAKRFGGQVLDTLGIENMIGTTYIEGEQLMDNVRKHVDDYPIEVIEGYNVTDINKDNDIVKVTLENNQELNAKAVIIATGANWRLIGIPGEVEFRNKGVAYCPNCDGPLYKGKKVAVIGGGNSGVEAALDLSLVADHVTVLEYLPELKADKVLQERLSERKNVTVVTNANTKEIYGDQAVEGLRYEDRISSQEEDLEVSAVFPLIGLSPNTKWLEGIVDLNERGEIIIDNVAKTSLEGVFAAGDCTDTVYKQIIISMGTGATAALGAFDYLMHEGKLNN